MSRLTRFERVAYRVAHAIGTGDCLIAGGLAVIAHGFVRATRDVDVVTRVPLAEASRRLLDAGLPTRLLRGGPLEGGFSCLKGEDGGVPFGVLPQLVPVQWEEATPVYGREPDAVRVVALGDLLAFKMKAQGPKDLMDAAVLVQLHPETRERALELATAYRVADRFEHWLHDPRIVAQAREEAAAERRRRGRPARGGAPTRAPKSGARKHTSRR
jgi:hypothetical protein